MTDTGFILHPKWIADGIHSKPLEEKAILVKDGIISAIDSLSSLKKQHPNLSVEHFPHHVLLPGWVNCHTHLAMNYFRGLADDLALMEWLQQHIWPAEKKWVNHDFVRDASLFAMAEMIRSGTTCFNDMYFFLEATAEAAETAGMRGCIGITVIDVPTAWAKSPSEYIKKGLRFYDTYKNHPLITTTLAPHAPYTVSDETLLEIKSIAKQHKLKINMHVHETADEIDQSLQQYQMRPLKRLDKLGLLSPDLIAIHMTQVNVEDFEILSQQKPFIVHCPESNMKLASGTCPITQLEASGLTIALGTDGAASNNDLNMLSEMRSAAFLAKLSTLKPTSLPASHVINMATSHGARALGLDHAIGTLEVGKAADFIAINLNEIETLPTYHPLSQIVYSASRHQVTDVWVQGKRLLKERELTTLNLTTLKEKLAGWVSKLNA